MVGEDAVLLLDRGTGVKTVEGSLLYLVSAGVVALIILVVLIAWNLRQFHRSPNAVALVEKEGRSVDLGGVSEAMLVSNDLGGVGQQEQKLASGPVRQMTDVGDEFEVHTIPMVIDMHEAEAAFGGLDEDQIVRMSAYEIPVSPAEQEDIGQTPTFSSEDHAFDEEFAKWLDIRLRQPNILGWFAVFANGYVSASDAAYDESVVDLFASLAENAQISAELVGLSRAREFVVRGIEGSIVIAPVSQFIPLRGDFLVVFLNEEAPSADLLRDLLDGGDKSFLSSAKGSCAILEK